MCRRRRIIVVEPTVLAVDIPVLEEVPGIEAPMPGDACGSEPPAPEQVAMPPIASPSGDAPDVSGLTPDDVSSVAPIGILVGATGEQHDDGEQHKASERSKPGRTPAANSGDRQQDGQRFDGLDKRAEECRRDGWRSSGPSHCRPVPKGLLRGLIRRCLTVNGGVPEERS